MSAIDITPALLTAYALGEVSPAEQAVITAHLLTHPHDRAEVEAIRAAADLLTHSLTSETNPGLDEKRRAALALLPHSTGSSVAPTSPHEKTQPVAPPRTIRFPHRVVWPSLVAACLVMGVITQNGSPQPQTSAESVGVSERTATAVDHPKDLPREASQPVAQTAIPQAKSSNEREESVVGRAPAAAAPIETQLAKAHVVAAPAPMAAIMTDQTADRAEKEFAVAEAEYTTGPASGPLGAVASRAGIDAAENGAAGCIVAATPPVELTPLLAWHATVQTPTARCALSRSDSGKKQHDAHEAPATSTSASTSTSTSTSTSAEAVRIELAAGRWPTPSHVDPRHLLTTYNGTSALATSAGPIIYASECPAPWDSSHRVLQLTVVGYQPNTQPNAHLAITFSPHLVRTWRVLTIPDVATSTLDTLYEITPAHSTTADSLANLSGTTVEPLPRVDLVWLLPHGQQTKQLSVLRDDASQDALFTAAVVEFAHVLQQRTGQWSLSGALRSATTSTAGRPERLRFVTLIRQAQAAQAPPLVPTAPAAEITPAIAPK